jgi:hypothetical protein
METVCFLSDSNRIFSCLFRTAASLRLWVPAQKRILNSDIRNDAGRWRLLSCRVAVSTDAHVWETHVTKVNLTFGGRINPQPNHFSWSIYSFCTLLWPAARAVQTHLQFSSPLLWLVTHAFRDLFSPSFFKITSHLPSFSHFYPEDGGVMFLRYVGTHPPDYTVSLAFTTEIAWVFTPESVSWAHI